ncbi:hypothetical protein LEP1GSC115_0063 [Leptospira interrogans serovar Australis str. 200703203]|uniref:Uncharacterized protein n=1 Tax=Leptospira interrogans serovar Australis str. 200703203 TaxID=1085541 RepID=N1UMZ2_LEPIR|nr:hypothetical protein LEP1GSC115_0063 [Leptospira interrogans serovar Australis str. 200703203]
MIRIKLSFPIRKFKQNLSFKTVYMIVLILLGFLSFQLIWEQRLKNLILASTQDEIELDNFLIYKEKKPSGNRKKVLPSI